MQMKIGDTVCFKRGIEQRGILRGFKTAAGVRLLVIEMWDTAEQLDYTVEELASRCWTEPG
jgi:hypothetical protein